ncbi:ABC transporter ATP-binding protein [Isoptericola sp. b441]|uniref:ABC transporter ATP-binding protein n=1 Tax=Actinotalea lenta TaxID=3064654 RepID=A0ABT9D9K5_9CELL|nr:MULTISPECIES: ABC transporter ATP-binding protein [unclassified Isoptericola]MDO8107260.1 ABC transporter ATP-binding protein [Isoptericola sp. b441]MDO8121077.1 ABC transporter ATP-binding protein [Isoptericola sp. b490]
MTATLEAIEVSRTFTSPAGPVHAVAQASLAVAAGELVAVRGRSGSGKTTLLNLMGGLDTPTAGRVLVDGVDLATLNPAARLALRRERIAFVFQSFGLLPELTARENVEVPLRLLRVPGPERDDRVAEALEAVGLTRHARQTPPQLSGGQRQRVGLARAVVARPAVLLADEPTGQLDSATGSEIMSLLQDLAHTHGMAALVATHDPLLLRNADRVLGIHDGRLAEPAR